MLETGAGTVDAEKYLRATDDEAGPIDGAAEVLIGNGSSRVPAITADSWCGAWSLKMQRGSEIGTTSRIAGIHIPAKRLPGAECHGKGSVARGCVEYK
jgi:hypothetical protein